jgi:hypothetical protein
MLEQIAEDKRLAVAAAVPLTVDLDWPIEAWTLALHIANWDAARVLAECEARRQIVELHTGHHECVVWAPEHAVGLPTRTTLVDPGFIHALDPTLLLLAQPLAHRPGFGEATTMPIYP